VSAPWRSGAAGPRRRLAPFGQDFDRGHLDYVRELDSSARFWLQTKPFSAPPTSELARCLRTFANIVELLGLGLRAQVLDVGCGPGWLSEFLARCGYTVTGVDISPDMVEIARKRIAELREIGEGLEAQAEFHALKVLELPWSNRFEAAILYDAMHHFDDELATLEVVRCSLVPGGQLFIHEGVLPPKGSESERNLVAEMERYGTLESPFDPNYLEGVARDAGFVDVRRLREVDGLVELNAEKRRFGRRADASGPAGLEYNVVHALNPARKGARPGFFAQLETEAHWHLEGHELVLTVRITNAGSSFWPATVEHPFRQGSITVAPYLAGTHGEREVELPRAPLPRSLASGESAAIELRVPRESATGRTAIAVDVVCEGVFWLADVGSDPLVVPIGS